LRHSLEFCRCLRRGEKAIRWQRNWRRAQRYLLTADRNADEQPRPMCQGRRRSWTRKRRELEQRQPQARRHVRRPPAQWRHHAMRRKSLGRPRPRHEARMTRLFQPTPRHGSGSPANCAAAESPQELSASRHCVNDDGPAVGVRDVCDLEQSSRCVSTDRHDDAVLHDPVTNWVAKAWTASSGDTPCRSALGATCGSLLS
jgi:hypothetical protein